VALEGLRSDKTIHQTVALHKMRPNRVSPWVRRAVGGPVSKASLKRNRGVVVTEDDEVDEVAATKLRGG